MKKISIVIAAFNEEKNLAVLTSAIIAVMANMGMSYEVIFVDDGSADSSMDKLRRLNAENKNIHYIKLSRNSGQQAALKAGIDAASGDCVVNMDADMQHPPTLIPALLKKWQEGYDVVYTIREETEGAGWFKRTTSKTFYQIVNLLSEEEIEAGSADFRLFDRKIADIIKDSKQIDLYLKIFIKTTGFKQIGIPYVAAERFAGETKWTFRGLFKLAVMGITSSSVKPLHFAAYLGLFFSGMALLYIPYILISKINGVAISGWSSLITTVVFFGGLQLFVLGIIGIYIGKIFRQVKQQPHYYIEETSLHV